MDFDDGMTIVKIFVLTLVLALAGTFVWLAFQPAMYNMQTDAIRNSNQYVTTKQQLLTSLMNDWLTLDSEIMTESEPTIVAAKKAQQKAVLIRLKQEAALLDQRYIPPAIVEFIAIAENR